MKTYWAIAVFGIWSMVTADAAAPDLKKLQTCIVQGLKPDITDAAYQQLVMRSALATRDEQRTLWSKEYGENYLSYFVLNNAAYERRLFAIDCLCDSATLAKAVLGEESRGRHVCDEADISGIRVDVHNEERGALLGTVTVARPGRYRISCIFVARTKDGNASWQLEYLGIANRLSADIRMSRPIFCRRNTWDEMDAQLNVLGLSLPPLKINMPAKRPSISN